MSRIDDILAEVLGELKETMGETSAMYAAAGFVDVVASKLKEANERFESATQPVGDKVREEFDKARAAFAGSKGDPRRARSLLDELPAVLLGGATQVAGWVDQAYQDLAQRGRDVVGEHDAASGGSGARGPAPVPDEEEPDDETPWGVVTPLSFIGKAASARAAARRASRAGTTDDDGDGAGTGRDRVTDDAGTPRPRSAGGPASRPAGGARTRKRAASVSRVVRGPRAGGEGSEASEASEGQESAKGSAPAAGGTGARRPEGATAATGSNSAAGPKAASGRAASARKVTAAKAPAAKPSVTKAAAEKAPAKASGAKASGAKASAAKPAAARPAAARTSAKTAAKSPAAKSSTKTPAAKTPAAKTPPGDG